MKVDQAQHFSLKGVIETLAAAFEGKLLKFVEMLNWIRSNAAILQSSRKFLLDSPNCANLRARERKLK